MRTLVLPLHTSPALPAALFGARRDYAPVALLDGPLAPDAPCAQPVYHSVVLPPARYEVRDADEVVGHYDWIGYSRGVWAYTWHEQRRREPREAARPEVRPVARERAA